MVFDFNIPEQLPSQVKWAVQANDGQGDAVRDAHHQRDELGSIAGAALRLHRSPKDHINVRISDSGWKARGLWDPCVYVAFWDG